MKGLVRVEKHIMRSSDPLYEGLIEDCSAATTLYNRSIFILRHAFLGQHSDIPEYQDLIKDERFISWYDLNKRMARLDEPAFRALKNNVAQQVIHDACQSFNTFFAANRAYKVNPKKFLGKPKLPDYQKTGTLHTLTYTYHSARMQKGGTINLSRDRKLPIHTNLTKFKELKVVPQNGYIKVLISYEKPLEIIDDLQNDKAIGIDLGVKNLMAITSNDGSICSIVNGSPLLFTIYRYNKAFGKLQEHHKSEEETSRYRHRLNAITSKRDFRSEDYLHKVSRYVVNVMIDNKISRCFIGLNPDWKQRCKMKHKTAAMQKFQQTAFRKLIHMITYKAEICGIKVETINESHTSKCSYYDDEGICHHERYVGKRVKRGCFMTGEGKLVNADINGSLNILKRGLGSHFGWHESFFNPRKVTLDASYRSQSL